MGDRDYLVPYFRISNFSDNCINMIESIFFYVLMPATTVNRIFVIIKRRTCSSVAILLWYRGKLLGSVG